MAQNQSKSRDEWPSRQRPIHKVTSAIRSVQAMIMVMKKKTKKNRFSGKICLSVFQKTNTIYAIHQCRVLDWSPKCADNNNDDCVNDELI